MAELPRAGQHFVADLELTVLDGRKQIGGVSPISLNAAVIRGEKPLLLAGRAWRVTAVDWSRHRVDVAPESDRGKVRWSSEPLPESFEMARARRDVLLRADPPATVTSRAVTALATVREAWSARVESEGLVLVRDDQEVVLWSLAGPRAHETLAAALPVEFEARSTNESLRFAPAFDLGGFRATVLDGALPFIAPDAVSGLKFSAALPADLARATLAERFTDHEHAAEVVRSPLISTRDSAPRR